MSSSFVDLQHFCRFVLKLCLCERFVQAFWPNTYLHVFDQVDPPVLCSDVFQILQAVTRSQAGRVARCFFHPTTFTKHMLAGAKVKNKSKNAVKTVIKVKKNSAICVFGFWFG